MKLEQQVCSLELSQKLKMLGVKQESLFWWVNGHGRMELHNYATDSDALSAFTVAELGEMLPNPITSVHRAKNEWVCGYSRPQPHNDQIVLEGAIEADARAAMLIYLIEQKLITV